MLVYHVTELRNLQAIQSGGLQPGMPTKFEQVGHGIYVFFDANRTLDIAEYIGIYTWNSIAIRVSFEVDPQDLLMDEDALFVDSESDIDKLKSILPPEAHAKYLRYLEYFKGGDEYPINDPKVAKFKIQLIDKYQIRPNKLFTTNWGHYSVLTAKCIKPHMIPSDIVILFEGDLYDLSQLEQIKAAAELD